MESAFSAGKQLLGATLHSIWRGLPVGIETAPRMTRRAGGKHPLPDGSRYYFMGPGILLSYRFKN
jgi:hypothetical protein